ncbi:MarR family transcriptional regulator [Pseudoalteromonas luteoviolacea]|uniref:MarR family winged helix-turn-helix transcriptional regulator n=1 Tax=Pseudoalteromonas luteoviolacea TaxID=43657 RepID=UPI001EEDF616|nr:MarR family transcriptional regulator [Pseudoalteromonas luteoviolacea]MCF6439297.1 MarR family transcriptional regulator [Pseudoalteromonas luteoviolacea]
MSAYLESLDQAFLAHFCRRLSDLISEQGAAAIHSYGITTPSTAISSMYYIEKNNGATVAELAEALCVTHQMATQRTHTLVKLELICRKPNPEDKRAKTLHLTELGKKEVMQLKPLTSKMTEIFTELTQQIECDLLQKVREAEKALIDTPLMQRLEALDKSQH